MSTQHLKLYISTCLHNISVDIYISPPHLVCGVFLGTDRQVIPELALLQLVGRHAEVELGHGEAGDGIVEVEPKGH